VTVSWLLQQARHFNPRPLGFHREPRPVAHRLRRALLLEEWVCDFHHAVAGADERDSRPSAHDEAQLTLLGR
jgi:hypothetical protein